MRPRSTPLPLACFVILVACTPLRAQDRGYHTEVELADRPNLPSGTRYIVLVNDSQKSIEAYDVTSGCTGSRARGGTSYDELSLTGDKDGITASNGASQPSILRPGGRMITRMPLGPSRPDCENTGEVDAVLFADGTYGGDTDAARDLQVYRDGVVASVRDWVSTLNQPGTLSTNAGAIQTEAQRRQDKDFVGIRATLGQHTASSYWYGRLAIDGNLWPETKPRSQGEAPDVTFQRAVQVAATLNKKIQDNFALKRLDVVFPLPPALAAQSNLPPPQNNPPKP